MNTRRSRFCIGHDAFDAISDDTDVPLIPVSTRAGITQDHAVKSLGSGGNAKRRPARSIDSTVKTPWNLMPPTPERPAERG